jgi:tripartite-type tricarboxylate transporter receptor subunit TctC
MKSIVAVLLACIGLWAPHSHAQASTFPERPVRIILPFGAGGLADITFRLVAERMTGLMGKQVLVENMPGAGGVNAANAALKSKPDGHTMIALTNGTAISKSLFKSLPFDPEKDFAPVSLVGYFDILVLARNGGPHNTLGDLLAAARSSPGKLNFATINPGSTQNLSAELFKSTAGLDVSIVPFKTSPEAATAVIAGNVDVVFESYAAMKSLISGGRLKPLAATGQKRNEYLPSLSTAMEAGVPGYEVVGWNALGVPAGTPPEVIAILNRHVNAVIAMPDVKARMLEFGLQAYAGPSSELRARMAADVAKWAAVIKKSGIQQQ